MSDSLRDALERIARGDVPLDIPASKFARDALAAHPVEPAKQCTCDPGPEGQHRYWCDLRYGPESEPVPVAFRGRVAEVLAVSFHKSDLGDLGWDDLDPIARLAYMDEAEQHADALLTAGVFRSLPTVDREALMVALHNEGAYCGDCDYDDGWKACKDCTKVLGWYAKAVLALIGGDAK